MFDTNPKLLSKLLDDVETCEMQLPDFQRGWVWDDDRIKGLLASISKGFPVGAIMTLKAGGDIKLKRRAIEGVDINPLPEPASFLLDGQQRLTSLYQALRFPGPVNTTDNRKKRLTLWYYIDIAKALDPDTDDVEDAIFSVPENKILTEDFGRTVTLDLSSPEKEYQNHMMPTEQLMNPMGWGFEYSKYWTEPGRIYQYGVPFDFFKRFDNEVAKEFQNYQLPVIDLSKNTPKEAVCTVFEKVNTGGVVLTTFELATAAFAVDESFSLRDNWNERKERLNKRGVLQGIDGDNFLQAIALLKTQDDRRRAVAQGRSGKQIPAVGCKKKDILDLELKDYLRWADKVERGFVEASYFLNSQSIYRAINVPYNTQIVSLAAIFVELRESGNNALTALQLDRLAQWYWAGIFGEYYGGAIESQFANDLVQVVPFVLTSENAPRIVNEVAFQPERLVSLRSRTSAAYKGVYALQMKGSAADWLMAQPLTAELVVEQGIDVHHVFPRKWCSDNKISARLYDSIINKTPIDATTNRRIGSKPPSRYIPEVILPQVGEEKVDALLRSHWLSQEVLESDRFSEVFVRRGQHMLDLIGKAIGKELGDGGGAFRQALTDHGQSIDDLYSDEGTDYDEYGAEEMESDAA